ncbi:MAG: integrase arm-type DNA-binding domain-containing protein [Alphaproteobacteria bacterium]|nr:integrase arm-type DNA-binding domain-containing protein [Alphaproteobacteria bacterium]
MLRWLGGNLYLSITPNGGKRWVFAYRGAPKPGSKNNRYEMGLGSAGPNGVSLKEARAKAVEARRLLSSGVDPLAEKRDTAKAERTIPTFGAFADQYIATHKTKFRNDKHVAQWEATLGEDYCGAIRSKPLNEIDTESVLAVLQPVWTKTPETASRLRGRIENVLDAAKAMGFRDGSNPATWRGHLKTLLPARQKLTRGHHAALAYDDLPAFMAALRSRQSLAAQALELCILTVTRTSEVLAAEWSEFDLEKALWTVPAQRMKAGHTHRIPLTERALDILKSLPRVGAYVFPGNSKGKPLSGMAMAMQLRRMKREDITVHGFRSTFRDWASEQTSFPHETCEHALAHRISDKAEAAYRRGDQFEKRRKLMEAWTAWCDRPAAGNVVAFNAVVKQ